MDPFPLHLPPTRLLRSKAWMWNQSPPQHRVLLVSRQGEIRSSPKAGPEQFTRVQWSV